MNTRVPAEYLKLCTMQSFEPFEDGKVSCRDNWNGMECKRLI